MEPKFWINYPQEHIEGEMYKYRCTYCKIETTAINGLIENHKEDCTFRIEQEKTSISATARMTQGEIS